MMEIKELALRKTQLVARLRAIAMSNVNGKSIEELAVLELDKIESFRELEQIDREIANYIKQ